MTFFTGLKKLIIGTAVGLCLVGCGKDETKPVKELKTTMTMDIDSLNPYKIVSSGSEEIMFNVYEGLLMPGVDGSLQPAIAESWTVSDDGKVYRFKIRKGVKFHDGTTLTPQDVVFSLNRMAGKDGFPPAKALLNEMESAKVVGDDIVEITLPNPNSAFIYALTMGIVPEANKDNLEKNPIGTGPFVFQSWTSGDKIVLKANPDYYKGKAASDTLTF